MTQAPKAIEDDAPLATVRLPLRNERQHDDDNLDEALEETFPASDPIAPSHIA